jgi:hypothetical protein
MPPSLSGFFAALTAIGRPSADTLFFFDIALSRKDRVYFP